MQKKYAAILVAAGHSSRMGGERSKILEKICGKTVFEHVLSAFGKSMSVSSVTVVCREEDSTEMRKLSAGYIKSIRFVTGGNTRQESVLNGVADAADSDYFVIHDAARPLVTPELIDRLCAGAQETGAAAAAVFAKDTFKLTDENGFVTETVPRKGLMAVQTPQVFEKNLYLSAAKQARAAGQDFTDDCQLVEFAGGRVHLVESDYRNIKITTPEDLLAAEAYMKGRAGMTRIGYGYDVHRLVENRKLIIGGVEIPFEKGLLGHSDADVLVHAVSDALLGAAAMGDIGTLFPDTDDRFAGADSLKLLAEVCRGVRRAGFEIGNIDATVIAQRPKMAPHILRMRENIAAACTVDVSAVGVKATTEERLGFTGREEGMAAAAAVTLVQF